MVEFMFRQAGIDVAVATTLEEAWRLAKTQIFDLYLLDGLMDGISSLDLCRDLHLFAPLTPILFYSALAYAADIQNGLAAGAEDYLVKPYFGDLSATVTAAVKKSKMPIETFVPDGIASLTPALKSFQTNN